MLLSGLCLRHHFRHSRISVSVPGILSVLVTVSVNVSVCVSISVYVDFVTVYVSSPFLTPSWLGLPYRLLSPHDLGHHFRCVSVIFSYSVPFPSPSSSPFPSQSRNRLRSSNQYEGYLFVIYIFFNNLLINYLLSNTFF